MCFRSEQSIDSLEEWKMNSRFERTADRPTRPTLSLLVKLAALVALSTASVGQAQEDIQWSITPYLWATTTRVDLTFRDNALGGGTIGFDDLLDVLDSAFMVNVEAGRGSWSLFADLTYLETSDSEQRPLLKVDTDSQQTVLDTGVAYWPGGVGSNLSLIGGLRYTDFDDRYRFSAGGTPLTERRNARDYFDALLGVRYRFDLGARWALLTHADFSFGDSEGSYLLRATLAWTVGRREMNRILLGYQYKRAEFKDGDLRSDYVYYGPTAGFNFRF